MTIILLCLLVLFLLALPVAAAEPPVFAMSAVVDFGPDVGQNFGTLFEVRDSAGRVIMGAGFPGIYNTCTRLDRYQLQLYIRPVEATRASRELLPRACPTSQQSVQDCDGRLYAWSYGADRTVRCWDGRSWQQTDLLDPQGNEFGDGFLRVAGRLLVFQQGQTWYDGRLILPRAAEGSYRTFYYAQGHLLCYHTKLGEEGFTRVCAIPWRPGEPAAAVERAVVQPAKYVGETPFAWGQLGDQALTVSNNGGVYVFEGGAWRVLREADKAVSYQVYSTVNQGDELLLGQYPTGNLLRYDGRAITHLPGWPPVMPGVSPGSREAQATMIYRGELYVGVWPWAELWRQDRDTGEWALAGRMFERPPISNAWGHPWEGEIRAYNEATGAEVVPNTWGQRVWGLAPWRDSMMVATSAKGPMERDPRLSFLTDEVYAEYGRVWRYTLPGNLAAPLQYRDRPTRIECVVERDRLVVRQDGEVRGEVALDRKLTAGLEPASVTWGRGIFGRTACRLEGRETKPAMPAAR